MTIPTLSDDQRRALGRLIWAHVDGVTANVHTVLNAINRDVICGVRVVATQEWEKANAALRALQDLTKQLEESVPGIGVEQLLAQLRDVAGTADRIAPKPARTPIY
jgi:hypothetical protein